jgi:hypothetical protein
LREIRIPHGRHGDQQLVCQITRIAHRVFTNEL